MKSHSTEIIVGGLACAILGFFQWWTLLKVATSLPGVAVDNHLNTELWIYFGFGAAGVLVFLVGVFAQASQKKEEPNQPPEPRAEWGRDFDHATSAPHDLVSPRKTARPHAARGSSVTLGKERS